MNDLTRRRFLAWSGVGIAALGGATTVGVADLLSAAEPGGGGPPVLVLVTLYGGNDGLNTVVPASDARYQDGRPDLAYEPEQVLPLGEDLGLNPGMPRLHGMWTAGQLAIVRGVGYPQADHSHFRSMAIWHTASPTAPTGSGWLGRWLDATGDDPMRAISLETTLPPFLAGVRSAASTIRPEGLPPAAAPYGDAHRALGAAVAADSPLEALVAGSIGDMYTVGAAVNAALTADPSGAAALGDQLGAIAALIGAGVPTRVFSASLGGFDTHADERGTQEQLLRTLDTALGGFADRIAQTGRRVVTVVYSEFGRRVRANASQGTDHGTAGPVFVFGSGVKGGFHGAQPSLGDLDDGDLQYTVDFRDVYASLVEGVLKVDPVTALGPWAGRVPLLS